MNCLPAQLCWVLERLFGVSRLRRLPAFSGRSFPRRLAARLDVPAALRPAARRLFRGHFRQL